MNGDLQLQQNVITELVIDASISSAVIGVEILEGIVTLTGRVSRIADVMTAERAAMRVTGVRAVVVKLVVNKLEGCLANLSRVESKPASPTTNATRRPPT